MRRLAPRAAALLIAALALAGCSAPAPSSDGANGSPSQSQPLQASPATGPVVSGDGYSYTVPEGWQVPTDTSSIRGANSAAVSSTPVDGFAENVNVVLSPSGAVSPDVVETQGKKELENGGATGVVVGDRVTVAGSESAHLSAAFASGGTSYQIEQYYVTHDKQTYVVTFSFSPSVASSARTTTAESVLTTWQWK